MDEELQPASPDERLLATSRAAANSSRAELERVKREIGFDDVEGTPPGEQPQASPTPGPAPQPQGPAPTGSEPGVISKIGDAAQATLENPKQAAAGAADVVSQVGQTSYDMANAFERWVSKTGFDVNFVDDDAHVDLGSYLAPKPQTEAERLARGTGKFLAQATAFIGATAFTGGVAAAAGAGAAGTMAAGALGTGAAGFAAFDPHEERLSNYINRYPAVRNIVTEYLAAKPGDTAIEGRFKNALENILADATLAAAFGSAIQGYKLLRVQKAAPGAGATIASIDQELAKSAAEGAAPAAGAELKMGGELGASNAAGAVDSGVENIAVKASTETPGNAQAVAAQTELPKIPAGEANPQGVPPGGTAAERAIKGMQDVSPEDLLAPMRPEEMQAILGEFNLEKFNLKPDSPMWQEALHNADALTEASGRGKFSDEEIFKRAVDLAQNPEELLKYRTGSTGVLPEHVLAANMRYQMSERVLTQKRDSLLAMIAQKDTGIAVSEATMNAARAEYQQARTATVSWYGVVQGTGGDAGRSLRIAKFAGDKIDPAFEMAILNADRVAMTGGGDALDTMAKQEAAILSGKVGAPDLVKHAQKTLLEDGATGTWSDRVHRAYLDVILSNPMTHAWNTTSNIAQNAVAMMDRVVGASYAYVSKRINGSGLKKEVLVTPELRETYFPGVPFSELSSADKALLESKAIEAAKLSEARLTFAQAGQFARGEVEGLWSDVLQLRFLSKNENAILSKEGPKFGSDVRRLTSQEWEALSPVEQFTHFASHFKRPTDALGAMDGMMGALVSRGSHRENAMRYAQALGRNELEVAEIFKEQMLKPSKFIRDAVDQARSEILLNGSVATAQLGKAVEGIRQVINNTPGMRYLKPFTTVATNMVDQAVQRTVGLSYLSPNFRAAMAAGGTARDTAIGKVGVGMVAMGFSAYGVQTGLVTGTAPSDPAARRAWEDAGNSAYSIKIGGKNIPLVALGPLGLVMRTGAVLGALYAYVPDGHRGEYEDLILTASALLVDHVTPDFLFDKMGEIQEATVNPTTAKSKAFAINVGSGLITPGLGRSMVRGETGPVMGGAVGALAGSNFGLPGAIAGAAVGAYAGSLEKGQKRSVKPSDTPWGDTGSDVLNGIIDRFVANIPGLASGSLKPQLNFFGEEAYYPWGHGPEVSSAIAFGPKGEKTTVEDELVRLRLAGPLYKLDQVDPNDEHLQVGLPSATIEKNGVQMRLTNEQYYNYQKLAAGHMDPLIEKGVMTKSQAGGVPTLRQAMTQMIENPAYQALSDYDKKLKLNVITRTYRERARELIMQVSPELGLQNIQGQINRLNKRTGGSAARGGQEPQL